MATQISDALVQVNDETVAIIPNTLVFTEGLGEQTIRVASAGGGETEQIYSNNIENNLSMVKFEIPATIENIKLSREWKINKNQNTVGVTGSAPEGDFDRTFTEAAMLNDYEVSLGSDTNITIEMKSNPAV